jgi:hypothetical protein
MSGKVYVFNVNAEEISALTVRSFATADKIAGWSTEASTRYTPKALGIDRIKLPENKFAFSQGDNLVAFSRPTYNGAFIISIPVDLSLTEDLILYVTRDKAILMRASGEVIEEKDFSPTLLKA